MKELETRFDKYGYSFNQVKSTKHGYIYEKYDGDRFECFEVFKRKENSYYGCVSFPTDKAFGIWAWAYHSLKSATDKLNKLSNEA